MNLKKIKIPVILDTDIGFDIDDTWALGLLLKCPELDVKLITTTSGNTLIKTKQVAKFLENADRTDIPIGIGPKNGNDEEPLYDWVKDYNLSDYPGVIHEDGIEIISDMLQNSLEPTTLIAIGPLGNIAKALRLNQKIMEKTRFIGMQGSIYKGYMGDPNPAVEYNVSSDIQACREVFQASWEKTITPLDTCGNIMLSGERFKRILDCSNPIVDSIKECYELWAQKSDRLYLITKKQTSTILFDTVAVYLAFSEELLNIENLKIEVNKSGRTLISEKGSNIRCATSWKNVQDFKDLIVDRLTS